MCDKVIIGMRFEQVQALAEKFPPKSDPPRPEDPPVLYCEYVSQPAYTSTQPVEPRVVATYSGRYQLDGGEWWPLGLTVEVEGDPVTLTPSELTTELVAPR